MKVSGCEFIHCQGDITKEIVDVIVNAANSGLLGGGGVDGAIHRVGGPAILEECKKIRAEQGRCPTGSAVVTGAGKLPAKYVVHTVGPLWSGGEKGEAELLASAYRSSLELALEVGAISVAFPSISTGAYRYPIESATEIALRTCFDFVHAHPGLEEIRFVVFSDRDKAVYRRRLDSLA